MRRSNRRGRRWFHKWRIGVVMMMLAIGAAAVLLLVHPTDPAVLPNKRDPEQAFIPIAFGLKRTPITRTILLDLCPPDQPSTRVECNTPTKPRPAIVSQSLNEDPRRHDHPNDQFPANQITVTAVNDGAQGVRVTVTADPSKPDDVVAGIYEATMVLQRENEKPILVTLVVGLTSRQGAATQRALAALFLGALVGAIAKWFNDNILPLTALRARSKKITQALLPVVNDLPDDAQQALKDLRDLRVADQKETDDELTALTKQCGQLRKFALRLSGARLVLERLRKQRPDTNNDAARSLKMGLQAIQTLKADAWPWEDPDSKVAAADQLAAQVDKLESDLQPASGTVDQIVSQGSSWFTSADTTPTVGAKQEASATSEATAAVVAEVAAEGAEASRNVRSILVDSTPLIAGAVLVGGGVAYGYANEFLKAPSFAGHPGDYLALGTWAFALQITGYTLAQLFGRLTQTTSTASGGSMS